MLKAKGFFCLFLLVSLFCFSRGIVGEEIDRIIAIVNDDVITEEELDYFIKLLSLEEPAPLREDQGEDIRRLFLTRMIEDRLILQEAKNQELKVEDQMIEDRIQDIKEKAGSEEAFRLALKQEGISLAELKEKLKNQLLIYMVIEKNVNSKVHVSPREVTDFFQENQERFVKPETVVVDSIFVEDREVLEEVAERLDREEDFQELSEEFSKRSNIGRVSRGQLKKELEDFIFGLEVGEYSEPFEMSDGFYVFLVKERIAASRETIEEAKDEISGHLEKTKRERILREWVEGLKEKAYISIRQ